MRIALFLVFLAACGTGSSATPPPPPAPARAPTAACVADVTADATTRARATCDDVGALGTAVVESLDDLDGDARPEQVVALDCGATGDCLRALYLSGHGCAHFAGAMRALRITQVGAWHHGAHDLETFESNGCAGLAGTITEWSFDGESYTDTSTLTCACPDETNAAARAPACPQPPTDVAAATS